MKKPQYKDTGLSELVKGVGKLPVEFMRAAKQLGHEVIVIAVVDGVEPELDRKSVV